MKCPLVLLSVSLSIPSVFALNMAEPSRSVAVLADDKETQYSEQSDDSLCDDFFVESENEIFKRGDRNSSARRIADESYADESYDDEIDVEFDVEFDDSDEEAYDDDRYYGYEDEVDSDEEEYDLQTSSDISFEEAKRKIEYEIKREEQRQMWFEREAAVAKNEGDFLKRECDDLKDRAETIERILKDSVRQMADVVGLDANSSEPSEIIAAAKNLMDENLALEEQIAEEQQAIERLDAESERLNGLIESARKISKERQNKISPALLSCQVNYVDPNYGFVGLNAGIDNGGVVIGSELAVMRNGKQICVLKVTNAESKSAVAEVKKGSLLKGNRIKVGDKVVPVKQK